MTRTLYPVHLSSIQLQPGSVPSMPIAMQISFFPPKLKGQRIQQLELRLSHSMLLIKLRKCPELVPKQQQVLHLKGLVPQHSMLRLGLCLSLCLSKCLCLCLSSCISLRCLSSLLWSSFLLRSCRSSFRLWFFLSFLFFLLCCLLLLLQLLGRSLLALCVCCINFNRSSLRLISDSRHVIGGNHVLCSWLTSFHFSN